jgi:hypothetical protein
MYNDYYPIVPLYGQSLLNFLAVDNDSKYFRSGHYNTLGDNVTFDT